MQLLIKRKIKTSSSTIGELYVNNVFECYTLEDIERPANAKKIFGKTAIPKGTYPVIINYSNRFKIPLPLLLNVPGFEGVRIHPGNAAEDTDGCILVGKSKAENKIFDSRKAFNILFNKLQRAYLKEKIILTIE